MGYQVLILQKEKSLKEFDIKYSLFKNDEIIKDEICTTFDIEVQKIEGLHIEKVKCPSVSSDVKVAVSMLEILYRNDVLPSTIQETMEECFEII